MCLTSWSGHVLVLSGGSVPQVVDVAAFSGRGNAPIVIESAAHHDPVNLATSDDWTSDVQVGMAPTP